MPTMMHDLPENRYEPEITLPGDAGDYRSSDFRTTASQPSVPPMPSASAPGTPGVYVRQHHNPNELDMLWSGSRQFHKEDRSPIIFTAAGFVLGVIITCAVFFLFTQKPDVKVGDTAGVEASDTQVFAEENSLDYAPEATTTEAAPAIKETTTPATPTEETTSDDSAASMLQRITGMKKEPAKAEPVATESSKTRTVSERRTHVVESGDTLGRIANKYYGQSGPNVISKIVTANNMANPDDIAIGQRLVIPD